MKRILIVNADDCNLTAGVTEAILDCHDHGILTSTTFMANLPADPSLLLELRGRKKLGVGIHLNVTLGEPVSSPAKIRSLLDHEERFKKLPARLDADPQSGHLYEEYENQILRFRKLLGRLPTHCDTHHHLHAYPVFCRVLEALARKFKLPVRRSGVLRNTVTTDYFFGNLSAQGFWRPEKLEVILRYLPEGVSEAMCHPGRNDKTLQSVSSFTDGREKEWRLFRNPELRERLRQQGIRLGHFGTCYTGRP